MMPTHSSDDDDDDDDDDDNGDDDNDSDIDLSQCSAHQKCLPNLFFSDRRFRIENSLTRRRWTRPPQAEDNSINQLSNSYHLPSHADMAGTSSDMDRYRGVPGGYPPWQQAPGDGSAVAQDTAGPSTGNSS